MLLARLQLLTLIGAIHNAVRANNGYTIINRVDVTVWSVSGGPEKNITISLLISSGQR